MLEDNHRVAIQGSAGTGKTVLALEKARRLSEEGQRTLLLCFNRPLADHLRRFASGFEVDTFHGFCSSKANLAKVSFHIPTGGSARDFWEDEAPLKLLEALEARSDDRYDAIVVDEGQDFREHWWPSIEEALNDPAKGTLYVFFDPHQNIYGGGPPAALDIAPTRLVFNCRNTQRIAEYAGELVSASTRVRPGAPAGAAVESFACGSPEEMVSQVRKQLHRLVVEEKIAADQIVVLSTRSTKKSALAKQRKLGNLHLVDIDSPPGPAEIRFGSLQRFKGLEADVVLLVDVEAEARTSSPEHLYVGTSRARHLLLLFSAASQK
jgi:superfamily I DNA/RNA helicase